MSTFFSTPQKEDSDPISLMESSRLEALREENAQRWSLVQDLHRQLMAGDDGDGNSAAATTSTTNSNNKHYPSLTLLQYLQSELELVPQNGVYNQCDCLLDQIESSATASITATSPRETTTLQREQRDLFAAEVVETFQQLLETNLVLQNSIQKQQQDVQAMERAVSEHAEIQTVLQQQLQRLQQQDANGDVVAMMAEDRGGEANHTAPQNQQQQEEEEKSNSSMNQQLKSDLKYLVKCVVEQQQKSLTAADALECASPTPHDDDDDGTTDETAAPTEQQLYDLIIKLVEQLVESPNHDEAYVSMIAADDAIINPKAVAILKQCWMIQTYQDDDSLIRLIDYD